MNVKYTGSPQTIGAFSGNSDLGLKSGIVLTTGALANPYGPLGPNNQGYAGLSNNLPGDSYLDTLASLSSAWPITTYNASVLEFDFIPQSDSVKFRYVFGSEEYMEFVNSGFNDVFGFALTGITVPFPKTNIALVPGTSTPVTINNVNLNLNSAWYHDNGNGSASGTAPDGQYIQYDGFTKVLIAKAAVQCGETYHIKIAVADAGDGILDSGVFLEAGSFSSNGALQISSTISFGSNDTTLFEGCGAARIVFKRGKEKIHQADTIKLNIAGTAQNGTDYSPIQNTVIFPIGVDSFIVTLNGLMDNVTEGVESIILSADMVDPCTKVKKTITISVYIDDFPPLKLTASNDTAVTCSAKPLILTALASGGTGKGYTYSWSNGATGATISVKPSQTSSYTVTVTDTCGVKPVTEVVNITFVSGDNFVITSSDDVLICKGDSAVLTVNAVGGIPGYFYKWDNNLGDMPTVTVKPDVSTDYTVNVKDSLCNSGTKTIKVQVSTTYADFLPLVNPDNSANFSNTSNTNAVWYEWSFGDASPLSNEQNPFHQYPDTGTYHVILVVQNAEGCLDTTDSYITIIPELNFYYPNSFSPNGDGKNDVFYGYGSGLKNYEMLIFNRWGELLFKSNDVNRGWDGKTESGSKLQIDTYIVVFSVEGMRDQAVVKTGHVNLIR